MKMICSPVGVREAMVVVERITMMIDGVEGDETRYEVGAPVADVRKVGVPVVDHLPKVLLGAFRVVKNGQLMKCKKHETEDSDSSLEILYYF
jgi:hypothetical protein